MAEFASEWDQPFQEVKKKTYRPKVAGENQYPQKKKVLYRKVPTVEQKPNSPIKPIIKYSISRIIRINASQENGFTGGPADWFSGKYIYIYIYIYNRQGILFSIWILWGGNEAR